MNKPRLPIYVPTKLANTVTKFLSNIYKLTIDEKTYVLIYHFTLFFKRILFSIESLTALMPRTRTNHPDKESNFTFFLNRNRYKSSVLMDRVGYKMAT